MGACFSDAPTGMLLSSLRRGRMASPSPSWVYTRWSMSDRPVTGSGSVVSHAAARAPMLLRKRSRGLPPRAGMNARPWSRACVCEAVDWAA